MKKSILAIAVLGAFAGAAQAQSSVTVYGVADIGYKANKDEGAGGSMKSSGISDGAVAGNRIGFRGTEDLGGGLKANFVIEQGISPTNDELFATRTATAGHQVDGQSAAANGAYSNGTNRQSWVGLSGGFGEVRIGYQYTNLYSISSLSGYNTTSEGVRGAENYHLHGQQVVGGTRANGITYITPNFSGFQATVQYGANSPGRESIEVGTAKIEGTRLGLRLNYAAGPISADLAHTQTKSRSTAASLTGLSAFGVAVPTTASANLGERTGKLTQGAFSYNFGVAKLTASVNSGEDGGTAATTVNSKYKSAQVGVRVPVGAFALVGSYGRAKTEAAGVNTFDEKGYQVGAQYSLSKRTMAYVYHGRSKDEGTARAALWAEKQSTIVGIFHSF
ncbi:MAG: porin [Pseudomonadota bacterium]